MTFFSFLGFYVKPYHYGQFEHNSIDKTPITISNVDSSIIYSIIVGLKKSYYMKK